MQKTLSRSTVLLLPLLVACSPNPSAEEVIDKTTPAICAKGRECYGEEKYLQAYPGGDDDCIKRTKDGVKEKRKEDLDNPSVCTDEEVDKCITDLKAAQCKEGGLPDVPCKC
ncbi:MAG: hypothetical protein KIT84_42755 [Labilithrix sp.]|nr:hypothetical protein [Labilithrix sp.]MCW5817799.1 hypothetical protein [Labilithrix sp.]